MPDHDHGKFDQQDIQMTTAAAGAVRKTALTTWEGIWYVLQCIALGAGYFGKIPAKKAMSDFGLTEMTAAEQFWYVVQCIAFGSGYFAKIPIAKALSELPQYRSDRQAGFGTLAQTQGSPSVPPAPPIMPPGPVSMPPAAPPGATLSPPDTPGGAPDQPPPPPDLPDAPGGPVTQ